MVRKSIPRSLYALLYVSKYLAGLLKLVENLTVSLLLSVLSPLASEPSLEAHAMSLDSFQPQFFILGLSLSLILPRYSSSQILNPTRI